MSESEIEATTPCVLAVEDNPADVRLIEEGIDEVSVDLELEVINNGQRAVERLARSETNRSPDLIFLDLNLPGKSGFEVLATIRAETKFLDVPVVVVSSSEKAADIDRVYDSEANAYVVKPVDPDEYIETIESAIEFWIPNASPNQ
jgi:CheY-like chemotaxis protein